MNIEDKNQVDHIDHNTLNNRKYNFRIVNIMQNSMHKKTKNKNNTSGYRNVSWIKSDQVYRVQLQINGKNTKLKDFPFDKLEEAGQYAKEMREKYYGEFAGGE